MKKVTGNLITMAQDGEFDVIIHGCNCFNVMGAGIAKQIADTFPDAYEADQATEKGNIWKLGTFIAVEINPNLTVINAYTQYTHWEPRAVDYCAIRDVFDNLNTALWQTTLFTQSSPRIGIPKIGAGLAGGDWDTIGPIIEKAAPDLDLTVVEYSG